MRTRVKYRIHDLVDSQLWSPEVLEAKPKNLFSKRGMKWLTSLEWVREEYRDVFHLPPWQSKSLLSTERMAWLMQ